MLGRRRSTTGHRKKRRKGREDSLGPCGLWRYVPCLLSLWSLSFRGMFTDNKMMEHGLREY